MKREDAIELLTASKAGLNLNTFSKVNKLMSVGECINTVLAGVENYPKGAILSDMFVKRVHQVLQNRRRPNYD